MIAYICSTTGKSTYDALHYLIWVHGCTPFGLLFFSQILFLFIPNEVLTLHFHAPSGSEDHRVDATFAQIVFFVSVFCAMTIIVLCADVPAVQCLHIVPPQPAA